MSTRIQPGSGIFAQAIWLGCLFLGFHAANGEELSADIAKRAALGWLRLDASPLSVHMSQAVQTVREFKEEHGGPLYYVVDLAPSGFVILPADDLVEPIIAFAGEGQFDPSLETPLGALVNHDLPNRLSQIREIRTARLDASALNARQKWQLLSKISTPGTGPAPEPLGLHRISDIRVPPLVQSRWNQRTALNGLACFNYYTPPFSAGNPNNYYCGCVATAMAQLMYYFQWPQLGVGTPAFTISVDGISRSARLRGGDGIGGPYVWASMPVDPANPTLAHPDWHLPFRRSQCPDYFPRSHR